MNDLHVPTAPAIVTPDVHPAALATLARSHGIEILGPPPIP